MYITTYWAAFAAKKEACVYMYSIDIFYSGILNICHRRKMFVVSGDRHPQWRILHVEVPRYSSTIVVAIVAQ